MSRYLPVMLALLLTSVLSIPRLSLAASPEVKDAETGQGVARLPEYLASVPLIPRETLLGNPDRAAPRISPDAKQLAYLAPVDGVLNVWVGPREKPDAARPVTQDTKRGIRSYFWAYNNLQIVYLRDQDGNEDWHVYGVDLSTGKTTDFTPLPGVRAEIEKVSHRFPGEILIGLNQRDPRVFDVYRLDLHSVQRQIVQENTEHFPALSSMTTTTSARHPRPSDAAATRKPLPKKKRRSSLRRRTSLSAISNVASIAGLAALIQNHAGWIVRRRCDR